MATAPARPLPPLTEDILRALPKTDLHCHLDGSLRLATILDLAERQKVRLPADTPEALAKAIHMGATCASLEDYLTAFDITLAVLQTEEALYRVAYELAIDCAAENVRYFEVRYSPVLHTRLGLKPTTIVDAVLEGLRQAKREAGIKSNVIICGIRHMDPKTSVRLAELAVAYKGKGVVGFDLAGAEEGHPARLHRDAIQLILDNNVNVTIHAGEAYGPDSIAQAVHKCGAHRIGHGVRLRENGELLNYLNDHRIPLEMCPSSNLQTGSVADFANHPLKFYFDFGLRVTINTDNRLITDTTITKELSIAQREMGFTLPDVCTLLVQGFKSAFLPFREKQDLLRQANAEIADVIARFSSPRPAAAPASR
jgi:adenosine deaminase